MSANRLRSRLGFRLLDTQRVRAGRPSGGQSGQNQAPRLPAGNSVDQ
jgi:hypothetical protein